MEFDDAISDELALIRNAQAGDRDAFGELVRRYRPLAINVVYRMCGDLPLAEDAAQTAFLRAWEKLGSYRPGGSFRAWILRISVHAAVDALRRRKPEGDLMAAGERPSAERVEEAVEKRERDCRVRAAVMSLPEASRAVLVLKEFQDCSYREIAEALEIPIGTVMSRLHYARSILVEKLRPEAEAA
ncbi:MAG: sigma-70 family RNA polymerase sigma factor [Anaerolineales bacterium]|nr:sigma-70 family RNA polymerase sigma factor [Anaerolineales bacterium]